MGKSEKSSLSQALINPCAERERRAAQIRESSASMDHWVLRALMPWARPLNPIFMLGGAPEAHEVLSKRPWIEIPLRPKTVPEAFPIKASDHAPGC